MKTKALLTAATVAGLTIGTFAIGTAGADPGLQSQDSAPSAEGTGIVLVQETGETEDDATPRSRRGRRGGCNLEAAANAIGVSEDALRESLDTGETIAEVAEDNGVDVQSVIDAMVDAKADRIADKVESGRITQEQADAKLAELETRTSDRVNGVDDADNT